MYLHNKASQKRPPPPLCNNYYPRENVIFNYFSKDLQNFDCCLWTELNITTSSVQTPFASRKLRRAFMFLALNRRKHELCEMVSQCLRKLDHYGLRFIIIKTKPKYQCPLCAILFFCKRILKIMKKKWPTLHLSPKRRKRISPYVETF